MAPRGDRPSLARSDCAELRQFLGRRAYSPYPEVGHAELFRSYQRLGLVAISSTEFFYDEFFRDVDHLAAYVTQTTAKISEWRLGPKPYVPERDRGALELYARYNQTSRGIRLKNHRWVFALYRGDPPRYPVDMAAYTTERAGVA